MIDELQDPMELEVLYQNLKAMLEGNVQDWYWTNRWRIGEKEADYDIQRGLVSKPFEDVQALIKDLEHSNPDKDQVDK
jgi:hypothetical protein